MTIESVRVFDAVSSHNGMSQRINPKPPSQVWQAPDPPFKGYRAPPKDGYAKSSPTTAIVIDNGSSLLRAGWSFDKTPRLSFPANVARYRDRKLNRACVFVGWDSYADATTRGQIRNAFEAGTGVVANWDIMEGVLDYTFVQLGLDASEQGIDRPVVLTEAIANLAYSRRMMNELLFECYQAPSVAYGIDALFSFRHNKGRSGMVVSSSHSSTHLIPVLNSRPLMSNVSRLNWGGYHGADYLLKLIKLKYPTFPGKLTETQVEHYVREHCYISQSFSNEMGQFLDWTGLEDRDHLIQYPFTEHVAIEKSEEELAKIAERKKESGRRLQEQAAKMRLEKLVRKEQELEYFKDLQSKIANTNKKEAKRLLDSEDMKDETQLERAIKDLETKIRKARNKDVGGPENPEETEEPDFPLLEIPDDQLDEAGLKQKRHQRLMKSSVEARARAKIEKEAEKNRIAEEERLDREHRENDLESWIAQRRSARADYLARIKDRDRLKADMGNRKSMASQMRMKTLANLASDTPGRKRRRGGDDDDFGANDDDWGVYRTVQTGEQSDDEEEEDLGAGLKTIEAQLLEYDPHFTEANTLEAQSDWTKSLMHAFLRGPRPFDPESQGEAHQVHLNVERIRVPEVVFQPAIAGLDQAGLVEIAADILNQRIRDDGDRRSMLRDIFLTGGNTLFRGFDERFERDLRQVLPLDTPMTVRKAQNALLDAWRGAAEWAGEDGAKAGAITREDYDEKGSEYLKVFTARVSHLCLESRLNNVVEMLTGRQEHNLGNHVGGNTS
ncbi:Nuclear actin-protein involved in chromatin remodeling [Agyrium rufum]|nr:Nuclear actin-protein involved in chromatin remodeling [Agyrium rufum]